MQTIHQGEIVKLFAYSKQNELQGAVADTASARTAQQGADIRYIAGGTTLIDLMKLNVETPDKLVDITGLPLDKIETTSDGGLCIGAMVRNSDLASHPYVQSHYPVLSQAILSGASAQLRNKATTGGNLLQKTRCVYYRDTAFACNKREPGSGCAAIDVDHRNLAILGTSEHCIASNPSDMNVALMALEAQIVIEGKDGKRIVPIADFYTLPGDTPHIETVLVPGDLITHVIVQGLAPGARSLYLKLRDRASYEFAVSSAAVIVEMHGDTINDARFAMGGIGTKPWRVAEAEQIIKGKRGGADGQATFKAAAARLLQGARPLKENSFKVELAKRCLVHALTTVSS